MKMMRLSEINRSMSKRNHQGIPHNIGIKSQEKVEAAGHEMKENPPKIIAHTRNKFGKARVEKQKKAITLEKARKEGARIPLKS